MRAMTSWEYYGFLVKEATDILPLFSPVLVPSLLAALLTTCFALSREKTRKGHVIAACCIPAIFPAMILLVGVAFFKPGRTAWSPGISDPVPWVSGANIDLAQQIILGIWFIHITLTVFFALKSRSGWIAVVCLGILWSVFILAADFASQESITGIWI